MSRFDDVCRGTEDSFGVSPEVVASAPGRLEILGNHTDYNEGVVLSTAVDCRTYFAVARNREDMKCRVKELSQGQSRCFGLDIAQEELPHSDWGNYVKGVVACLQQRGVNVPAFQGCILGDVPLSAGMSSSAALEMSLVYGLLCLSGESLEWQEIARVGQQAENDYVGAQTGLLDQYSSINGVANNFVFCDFRSYEVKTVPVPEGVALVVANSKVKHSLTDEYNERRKDCEAAVSFLQSHGENVDSLRDVDRKLLGKYKEQMEPLPYHRALHVTGENERVKEALTLLEREDLEGFGKLLNASHESSRINFQNSTPELDILVALSQEYNGVYGARLSGGGFGGITVHAVPDTVTSAYSEYLRAEYKKQTGVDPDIITCHSGDGASAERIKAAGALS